MQKLRNIVTELNEDGTDRYKSSTKIVWLGIPSPINFQSLMV